MENAGHRGIERTAIAAAQCLGNAQGQNTSQMALAQWCTSAYYYGNYVSTVEV